MNHPPMKYRLKTHDELLDAGFALTPAGNYVHSKWDELTPATLEYARQFSQALIKTLFESPNLNRKYIDSHLYCAGHFVSEPVLKG